MQSELVTPGVDAVYEAGEEMARFVRGQAEDLAVAREAADLEEFFGALRARRAAGQHIDLLALLPACEEVTK